MTHTPSTPSEPAQHDPERDRFLQALERARRDPSIPALRSALESGDPRAVMRALRSHVIVRQATR